MFLLPEEEVAWLGPAQAKVVINFVDKTIIQTLDKVVTEFMKDGKIHSKIIDQEFMKLQNIVDKIEEAINTYLGLPQFMWDG